MLVAILFFLALIVSGGLAYGLTKSAIKGRWRAEGPARVSQGLKRRNRLLALGVLAVLAVVALLEAVLADLHDWLVDLQYNLPGTFEAGISDFSSGGISWALYLGVFLGTLMGLLLGSLLGARTFAMTRGLGAGDML